MPTGACGINCDVCKLQVMGICSTCGSGVSSDAEKKVEAQIRILGQPCPILECARINRHPYCMRDCPLFPCHNFQTGPYPFSAGFLNMQDRRRKQQPSSRSSRIGNFIVPSELWEGLEQKDIQELCRLSLTTPHPPQGLSLTFLNRIILVDINNRELNGYKNNLWEKLNDPMLELMILVYLNHVKQDILTNELITSKDLKDAQFFQGPHEIKTKPLLDRYGNDIDGFKRVADYLNGVRMNMADAAYKLTPLPKIPLYYLLWAGDEEFPPRLSILFDRSIEKHLAADAVWGLVNLVSDILLFPD